MSKTEVYFHSFKNPHNAELSGREKQVHGYLQDALRENFFTTPFYSLDLGRTTTSFFTDAPVIIEAGDFGAFSAFNCFIGICFRKGKFVADSSTTSKDEFLKKLSGLYQHSRLLSNIECHELRLDGERCFHLRLTWKNPHHLVCKSVIDKYGFRAYKTQFQPTKTPEISNYMLGEIFKRIEKFSPHLPDAKLSPNRFFRSLEISADKWEHIFGSSFPQDHVVYIQRLDNSKDSFKLFYDLSKVTTKTRLPEINKVANPDFLSMSTWVSTRSHKPAKVNGIYNIGRNIFDIVKNIEYLFADSGMYQEINKNTKLGSPSNSISRVITELILNALIHGAVDRGEDWTRDDKHSWFYANAIVVGNFPNRIEIMNHKPNNLLFHQSIDEILGQKPFRSSLHVFLKDIGFVNARGLGQYIIRYSLHNLGAPSPIFLDSGTKYRAVLPKEECIGSFFTPKKELDKAKSTELLNRAFVLKLMKVVKNASIYEIASTLAIPTSLTSRILQHYSSKGIFEAQGDVKHFLPQYLDSPGRKFRLLEDTLLDCEIEECLKDFKPNPAIGPMLIQDLLELSKRFIPPHYLVEKDFLNYIRFNVLEDKYAKHHEEEILRFSKNIYSRSPLDL